MDDSSLLRIQELEKIVNAFCLQYSSSGINPVFDSNNPAEALYARAILCLQRRSQSFI